MSKEGGFAQLQLMAVIWYDGPSILLLERLGFQKKTGNPDFLYVKFPYT